MKSDLKNYEKRNENAYKEELYFEGPTVPTTENF